MKRSVLITTGLLFAVFAVLVWQHGRNAEVSEQNRILHARIREAAIQRDEAQAQALELATNGLADLNRLMSENARLRNELAASRRPAAPAAVPRKSPAATNAPEAELPVPVRAFAAQSTGELKPGETLVTGGWPAGNGGRGFMFLTLRPSEPGNDSLAFRASIFEMSEQQIAGLGLGHFRSDAQGNSPSALLDLDAAATAKLITTLKSTEGVRHTSSPSLVTRPGVEASMFIGNQVPVAGGKYADVGHSLTLLPVAGPNGIKVTVTAGETRLPQDGTGQ